MADATQKAPEDQPKQEATTPTAENAAPPKPKASEETAAPARPPVAEEEETEASFTGITNAAQGNEPPKPPQAPEPPAAPQPEPAAAAPATPAAPKAEEPKKPAAEAEGNAPPAAEQEEETPPKSKFLAQGDNLKLMEAWQLKTMPEELQEALEGGGIKQSMYGGFEFTTAQGQKFGWRIDGDGKESIGQHGLFVRMSPELAAAEVAAAKAHGWEKINVFGNTAKKEMLWLAAMRAGLEVKNFEPDPNSAVAKKWAKEKDAPLMDITQAEPEKAAPKAEAPKAEAPKAEAPKADAPADEKPATPAAAAAEAPAADTPAPPQAEAPAVEQPAAPKADAPVASKFGGVAAEAPKAETPAVETPKAEAPAAPAAAETKPTKEYPQWEADKALFASKPEGQEVSPEGRKNIEAVEGMTKRAEGIKDPAHREGIEKLQDAIKSGKVKVEGPLEREIINNVDSPKGFNKAAEYFANKSGGDLGISKVAVDTANNENNGQRRGGPKAKNAAP